MDTTDALALIASRSPMRVEVGVILGSGLGPVADAIQSPVTIPYREISGFPGTTVPGHRGEMVMGMMEGIGVAALRGRVHLYEGYSPAEVCFPVRLLGALGARVLVVTNAAGGLRPGMEQGSLMVLEDHINLPGLAGLNPLAGQGNAVGRFVDMSAAYDHELREVILSAAREKGIRATSGIYSMVVGPSYETPAEARLLRQWGADAVGMSTVPEVVMARRLEMRVAGISCITNVLLDKHAQGEVDHLGVVAASQRAVPDVVFLLRALLRHLSTESRP